MILVIIPTLLCRGAKSGFLDEDLGRVLAGIQVPPSDYDRFGTFLSKLGYRCVEETENPIYKRFLRSA